jgi:hypothetical protein
MLLFVENHKPIVEPLQHQHHLLAQPRHGVLERSNDVPDCADGGGQRQAPRFHQLGPGHVGLCAGG